MTGEVHTPIRGCGTRVKGGVYLVCGLSANGQPVEHFLVDSPVPLNDDLRRELGISAVGIRLAEHKSGPPHVFDWVGEMHYPNVCDFVEEVKRFGMSRRAPVNFDFHKLRRGSMQMLIHAKGHIEKPEEYQLSRMGIEEGYRHCPKRPPVASHQTLATDEDKQMCAGLWWEDVVGNEPGPYAADWPRSVTRHMPSFSYHAWAKPAWAAPTYTPAIFMALPITGIHVINDPDGGRHEDPLQKLRGVAVPVELRDE